METNVVFAHERLAVFSIRGLAPATDLARARGLLHEIVCLLSALARSARERAR